MGIRITDQADSVAMYDSTTMWAFGPVFESSFDAENFMRWADSIKGVKDLRRIDERELHAIHDEWHETDWRAYDDGERAEYAPYEIINKAD